MSSSRRGRKSAADQINHDTTGLSGSVMDSAQEAGAQTRSSKRKLVHEKKAVDANPKHLSSAREPAAKKSKTSKAKTAVKTSATDKNSKNKALEKPQAVVPQPSKTASTTIQRNVQLSSKATSEQSGDGKKRRGRPPSILSSNEESDEDNVVSVNSSPMHEQVHDTKEAQEDEYEEEEQTDQEDEELLDERQGDQDAARYLQNEAPRITVIGSPKERSGRGAQCATEEFEEIVDTMP
ncbi:hypothetical protein EV360DRAFT_76240 [Lentinula raphanica]|nr:hypothetical protein EV360DRAFT_76240 [Lentinula raphanica]